MSEQSMLSNPSGHGEDSPAFAGAPVAEIGDGRDDASGDEA
jgi:hypothetical protein